MAELILQKIAVTSPAANEIKSVAGPLIKAENLSLHYGSARALKNIGVQLDEKVVTVPGSAFGERGKGHVRACYATSLEKIEEACDRIARFVGRA